MGTRTHHGIAPGPPALRDPAATLISDTPISLPSALNDRSAVPAASPVLSGTVPAPAVVSRPPDAAPDRLLERSLWRRGEECCAGYEYVVTWRDGPGASPLVWPNGETLATGFPVAPDKVVDLVEGLRDTTDIEFATLMVRCARCGQWHP